ncbi:MAG: PilT/PilU family type 4a pilus ATPase [Gemmataceae bacterium]
MNDTAALVAKLLAECVRTDASDLHLASGEPPHLRIHGILAPIPEHPAMSAAVLEEVANELLLERPRKLLQEIGAMDGAFTAADGTRFRFNVFRRQNQLAIALRRLEDRFRTLKELGFPESLYSLCDLADGLVLVCGPTGAGKSTTLATLLDRINQTRRCHIITIEDPIEYLHRNAMSLVNQRQVGSDTASFNDALVASLRQDPDVILVGEIRDLATIRTAITAAETGHLVLTTVHAGDCVGTIERLVSVFPADEQSGIRRQLSLVLRAVVAQHLLVADGPAAKASGPNRRPRVVASEVLMANPAIANLIATAKSNQIYSALETGGGQGMHTLEHDLARLWVGGHITEQTASTMARNPAVMRDRAAMMKKDARPGVR